MYNKVKNVKNVKNIKKTKNFGDDIMEVAKISSKGQITIPISVRHALKLKSGDKVVIQEENGRFYFDNAALVAFGRVENEFKGAAAEADFSNEAEMQEYMKEIRGEVRGY